MPIYNVEKYLAEAIDSVIAQDIGFRKNVQLILVNDGSPDNSGEICEKYAAQYPENIFYYKKKNGGLSDARNFGLRHVVGELITFTDPDDTLSENVFSEVWDFYEKNRDKNLAFICIPLVYFGAQNGLHAKYKGFGAKNCTFDLRDNPNAFILSSASTFYERKIIKNRTFSRELSTEEDTLFNTEILLENNLRFGYVAKNNVQYNYRKRFEGGSQSDASASGLNVRTFYAPWQLFEKISQKVDKIADFAFLPELFIYEIRSRISQISPEKIGAENFADLIKKYRNINREIPVSTKEKSIWLPTKQHKFTFLSNFGEKKLTKITKNNELVFENGAKFFFGRPILQKISQVRKKVVLDVIFYHYDLPMEIFLKAKNSEKIIKPKQIRLNMKTSHDLHYGDFYVSGVNHAKFIIDKNDIGKYDLRIKLGEVENKICFYVAKYSPFLQNSQKIRKNYGEIDLKIYDGTVEILTKGNRFDYLKSEILTTFSLLRRYHNVAKTRFLGFFAKKWILISDRPFKAGDNGEALFKYIAKNEPEIKKYTRFVLEKNSPDYERMKQYGKVVPHGSLRHKFYFLNSKLLISSHNHPKFISPDGYKNFHMYADLMERKMIWLQHGVTKDNIFGAANKFNQGLSAVVLSTDSEKKIFSQENFFYDEKDLITSGFPRWDYNENNAEKLITIAPTWRSFLSGAILENGTHEIKEGFEDSEYFRAWSGILANQDLLKQLRAKNIKIDFLMHPAFIAKVDLFKKFENDVVRILEFANYQEIFAKSALMITDFSSAVFDFAYLRKPVLYYQFDKEEFFASHYQPSKFFDYKKNAPGAVVTSENDLIREILKIVDANFAVPEKYRARAEKMFFHNDKNNSRRVVEYLKKNDYL